MIYIDEDAKIRFNYIEPQNLILIYETSKTEPSIAIITLIDAYNKVLSTYLLLVGLYPEKKFSKAIWDNTTNLTAHVKHVITKGIASGSSVQKMVRELRQVTQKEKYVLERLVRTECKYFANQSELTAYKESGINQYVFMGGTEGSINCKCKDYNNKIFNTNDAEAGVNFPPMHPNCKCCIRAYFENSILNNNKNTSLFEENDLNNKSIDDIIKETDFSKLENIKTSDGLTIKNISKHFKERTIERGVEIDAIKDSLINPVLIGDIEYDKNNKPSKEYFGEKARTQVNPITNNLITTWKMSSKTLGKIRRKLKNENKLE